VSASVPQLVSENTTAFLFRILFQSTNLVHVYVNPKCYCNTARSTNFASCFYIFPFILPFSELLHIFHLILSWLQCYEFLSISSFGFHSNKIGRYHTGMIFNLSVCGFIFHLFAIIPLLLLRLLRLAPVDSFHSLGANETNSLFDKMLH